MQPVLHSADGAGDPDMGSVVHNHFESRHPDPAAIDTAHRLKDHHFTSALFLARLQRSRCLLDRNEYMFWTQVCDLLERADDWN